jgi:hypothetical protein
LWLGESNQKIKMEDVHAVALELEAADAAGVDVDAAPGVVPELDTAPAPAPAHATEVRTVVLSEALGRVLAALRDMSRESFHMRGCTLWPIDSGASLKWDDVHEVAREVEAAGVVSGGDAKGGAA